MSESSTLTLPSITHLSKIILDQDNGSSLLRANADFVKYVLAVTHHKLSKVSAYISYRYPLPCLMCSAYTHLLFMSQLTSQEELEPSVYQNLVMLANVFMAEVIAKVGDKDDQPAAGDNASKVSTELALSIECLVLLPQLVHHLYPKKVVHFLVTMLQAAQASQLSYDVEVEILVKHLIMVLQVSH